MTVCFHCKKEIKGKPVEISICSWCQDCYDYVYKVIPRLMFHNKNRKKLEKRYGEHCHICLKKKHGVINQSGYDVCRDCRFMMRDNDEKRKKKY